MNKDVTLKITYDTTEATKQGIINVVAECSGAIRYIEEVKVMDTVDVEFNNGFVTALGLFYGHREQWRELRKSQPSDNRIYAASDHLYDIEYPEGLDNEVKEKVSAFVDLVFSQRLEQISWGEADQIFEDCRGLLALIDEKVFGLDVTINYG